MNLQIRVSVSLIVLLTIAGCASTRIAVKETFGYEKREQLVDGVEATRDAQEEAKEQFATTLDEFKSLTGFHGGDLEEAYDRLKDNLEESEDRADNVRGRIESVDRVANALFTEWEEELEQYTTASLRQASQKQLRETRNRYQQVVAAMRRAESRMDPVLAAFADQVLFLKHNLNARAIASLDETVMELEDEIADLIADMNRSIDEANTFIDQMSST